MMRVIPYGAFGEAKLLPVIACAWCDDTWDVEPIYDPWGVFQEYVCGDCLSGQEGMNWNDAMELAHPLRDGTERY